MEKGKRPVPYEERVEIQTEKREPRLENRYERRPECPWRK